MIKPRVEETAPSESRERLLLSADVRVYHDRNQYKTSQLLITKSQMIISREELIVRAFSLASIDAITISVVSPEFVVHLKDGVDERMSCSQRRRDVVEMLVYLLCNSPASAKDAGKVRLYLVGDLNLDFYTTTEEDLEDGHVIRPDKKDLHLMDHLEFIEHEKQKEKKIRDQRRTSQTLIPGPKHTVTIDDFDLLMLLGKGAHGKVLLCERKGHSGELYAIKILKKQHVISANQLEHTMTEMKVLAGVHHPFLVPLRHAFHTDSKIYFVMDFMKGGELFQHMRRVGKFPEDQAKFICACLVLALGHLHSAGYIYRDLKPENILLDEQGFARLTDFGLAKLVKQTDVAKTFCGTPEYMAPEVIVHKGCNRPADWWSLGILTYELLFGAPPFYSYDVQEMYRKTCCETLRFPAKSGVSRLAMDFCSGLLQKKCTKRLGSVADSLEIMNHPWLADTEWSKLLAMKLKPPFRPNCKKWAKNFDPEFVNEIPRDSKSDIDPASLIKYQEEFRIFTYKEQETDISLLKHTSDSSNRQYLLAKAFRENLKVDLSQNSSNSSKQNLSETNEQPAKTTEISEEAIPEVVEADGKLSGKDSLFKERPPVLSKS
jgi:serum/glucocorticoid-regulated kinase 2